MLTNCLERTCSRIPFMKCVSCITWSLLWLTMNWISSETTWYSNQKSEWLILSLSRRNVKFGCSSIWNRFGFEVDLISSSHTSFLTSLCRNNYTYTGVFMCHAQMSNCSWKIRVQIGKYGQLGPCRFGMNFTNCILTICLVRTRRSATLWSIWWKTMLQMA